VTRAVVLPYVDARIHHLRIFSCSARGSVGDPNDLRAYRARTGSEILPRRFSNPCSSVFSASSIFPMARSVAFRDDPSRGIGHDFGQNFRYVSRCKLLPKIVTEGERRESSRKRLADRGLHLRNKEGPLHIEVNGPSRKLTSLHRC
jgi:hypothetical protein